MNDTDVRPFYYSQVRVDPKIPNRVYWSSTPVNFSDDGGKTVRNATDGIHVDHHAMWIDPNDPEHFIVGDDGGVSQTWDRGGNYEFLNRIAIGQFYEVSYDMSRAVPRVRRAAGQRQLVRTEPEAQRADHERGLVHGRRRRRILHGAGSDEPEHHLRRVAGRRHSPARLRHRRAHAAREAHVASALSAVRGLDSRRARRHDASPVDDRRRSASPSCARCSRSRLDRARPALQLEHAVLHLAAHSRRRSTSAATACSSRRTAATTCFRSRPICRRATWRRSAGAWTPPAASRNDATGAETYGTIMALAESYMRPGLLFAGTDDGNVWLTHNDGATWENLTGRFPGVPPKTYVVRIEPSHFDSATFYVAFDNHRVNDFTPYLYVTTDFGKTFRSIVNDLPKGGPDFLHVIREDPVNRDLLLRRHRRRRVRLARSRTELAEVHERAADGAGARSQDSSARPRADRGDARPRHLDRGHRAARAAQRQRVSRRARICSRRRRRTSSARRRAPTFPPARALFKGRSAPFGADIAYRLTSGSPKDSVKIVVTNLKGDTLKTLTGQAAGRECITSRGT